MNQLSAAVIVSFLAPALVLMLLFGAILRRLRVDVRGGKWLASLGLVSLSLLTIPIQRLPLARWLAGIVDHWSVPLMAVLACAVVKRFLGIELLRWKDRQTACWFGVGTALALYPMALGLGPLDPYYLGWHFGPLFVVMAALTAFLLWRRDRFGIVLLLAIAAWHLRVPESDNYWDCLVDPFYFLVSLGALVWQLARRKAKASHTLAETSFRNP